MKEGEGVRLVVVRRVEPSFNCNPDHDLFRCVTHTCPVLLDCADGHALVRHLSQLAPLCQRSQETTVHVGSCHTGVISHLLVGEAEEGGVCEPHHLVKPPLELEIPHTATFKAGIGREALCA